jgi:prepilin-type processing-associated H-X9-DG protein
MPRNTHGPYGQDSGFQGNVDMPADPYWLLPTRYEPRTNRIGNTARKIFAADAARRTRNFSDKSDTPYYLLTASPSKVNSNESMFSDWGPFCGNTRSYDRSPIAGNASAVPSTDIRRLSFRHGKTTPFQASDLFVLNAVFYDGHVEALDGNAAADPNLWLPAGTVITKPAAASHAPDGSAIIYADVAARFHITDNYVVK